MRSLLLAPVLIAGLIGLSGCDIEDFGSFGRYSKDFHYSYPLKPGGRVSIESFNGSVELSSWDQDTVDVSGSKYGPTQEGAEAVKVDVDNSPDSVSIRVVRPSERRGNWGARFAVRMPKRALVDLIKTSNGAIRVVDGTGPARLRTSNGAIRVQGLTGGVEAQTSNGTVELVDVEGDVTARTSNGRIHADNLKGGLQASTSNGAITATLASGVSGRPLRLDTSNGGVDLTLPEKFDSDVRVGTSNGHITLHMSGAVNARVLARTSNSSISTDFDVRMQGEFNKNHMDGVIGTGGPLLDLNTSNGGIRLARM